jgi:hypothetical protein
LAVAKKTEAGAAAEDAAILAGLLHHFTLARAADANGAAGETQSAWKRDARREQVDRATDPRR